MSHRQSPTIGVRSSRLWRWSCSAWAGSASRRANSCSGPFVHPSRTRLVNYADVVAYLKALRCLEPAAPQRQRRCPLRRPDLLRCSDELLVQLQWGAAQGRQLLEDQFGKASRQQLSDEQLLQFNQLLEEQLIKAC